MGSVDSDTITYKESMGDMDIIFAGGGTAACVAAGRLAKANPDLKILLIEGGPNQFEVSQSVVPVTTSLTTIEPCSSKPRLVPQPSRTRHEDCPILQIKSFRAPQWT